MELPDNLIEYLMTMISPPGEKALFIEHLDLMPTHPENSVPGFIVQGTPTPEQSAELVKMLKPGAHLYLIAPEEQPTGHTGACNIEDAGLEIRDAVLWARRGDGLHYVPKASRSEREEGCFNLKGKAGHEAVERKEGTAGLNNPRAGAGRTATHVKNFHPTVKPVELIERLLVDMPKDQGPMSDWFLGSGTAPIACLKTGHDFVGTEREAEYLEIADTRVRHEDTATAGWIAAKIESDHVPKAEPEVETMTLDDLFGF